jgi:hypothetical protein
MLAREISIRRGILSLCAMALASAAYAQSDPGPRGGTVGAGGVGQRIFFLHDGRAGPSNGGVLRAILAHESTNSACASGQAFTSDGVACRSEANAVIGNFTGLSASQQQDILNFLRSL